MSAETTATFIARTVAVFPHLDDWNKRRELASLRRQAAFGCEASKAVLKALNEPELEGWLAHVFRGSKSVAAPVGRRAAA